MYKDQREYEKSSASKKCIACDGDVKLEAGIKGYDDHVCISTGKIGWRCENCDYCWHSNNRYGHSGSPMRCPKCGSIHVTTPS